MCRRVQLRLRKRWAIQDERGQRRSLGKLRDTLLLGERLDNKVVEIFTLSSGRNLAKARLEGCEMSKRCCVPSFVAVTRLNDH